MYSDFHPTYYNLSIFKIIQIRPLILLKHHFLSQNINPQKKKILNSKEILCYKQIESLSLSLNFIFELASEMYIIYVLDEKGVRIKYEMNALALALALALEVVQ